MMLHNEKLDELFQLLKDMTVPPPKDTSPPPARLARRIENWLMIVLVAAILLLVIIVACRRFSSPPPLPGVTIAISTLSAAILLLAFFYPIIVIIDVAGTAWRQRYECFPVLFAALQKSLRTDAFFLTHLWSFDKPTLEYGLIQYRHHWSIPDRRVGSLVGDVRKIGLLPALATAVVSAITLKKADSDLYLWIPLAVTCAFYLIGFIAVNQRERPDQVIGLLEYAIRHVDDPHSPVRTDAVSAKPSSELATPPDVALPMSA